jgi:hypothetical protein
MVMRVKGGKAAATESPAARCDIKVWSGECERSDSRTGKSEYACALCGTIRNIDHEVHHELFPHVSGDTDNLS